MKHSENRQLLTEICCNAHDSQGQLAFVLSSVFSISLAHS